MTRRFIGKYATGHRKAVEFAAAESAYIKSLPLATRKLMKDRDAACAAFNQSVIDGKDCGTVNALGREYHRLKQAVIDAL
jgi:hypothetical protein